MQSHWFSVGSVVTWARAGVGAVATQSIAEPATAGDCSTAWRRARAVGDALTAELDADPQRRFRQLA